MAKQLTDMETLFRALADATRLRILGLLLTGEVCVCDIHESLKIPQPKTSRHLARPERRAVVHREHEAIVVALRERDAGKARRAMLDHLLGVRQNLLGY